MADRDKKLKSWSGVINSPLNKNRHRQAEFYCYGLSWKAIDEALWKAIYGKTAPEFRQAGCMSDDDEKVCRENPGVIFWRGLGEWSSPLHKMEPYRKDARDGEA